MIDKKVQNRLNEMDKILFSLNEIVKKLYDKSNNSNLDDDTIAFLIYVAELLQKLQIDLKDTNINFIKDFIPTSFEKSKLLCQNIAEKSDMEQKQFQKEIEALKYFHNREMQEELMTIRH